MEPPLFGLQGGQGWSHSFSFHIKFIFRHLSQRCQVLASDHAEQVGYEYNQLSSLLEAANTCEDDLAAVIVSAFDYRYSRQAFVALAPILIISHSDVGCVDCF